MGAPQASARGTIADTAPEDDNTSHCMRVGAPTLERASNVARVHSHRGNDVADLFSGMAMMMAKLELRQLSAGQGLHTPWFHVTLTSYRKGLEGDTAPVATTSLGMNT